MLGFMATRNIRARLPLQNPSHADIDALALCAAELETQSIDPDAPLVDAAGMDVSAGDA